MPSAPRRLASVLLSSPERLVWALCACGLVLRLVVLALFPDFITEDSDGYILAADYVRFGDPELRINLGHRQLGYPALILALRSYCPHPFFVLAVVQILLSVASCYLVYWLARQLRVRSGGAVAACAFFVFNRQSITYAITVAPETLVLFLLLLSISLFLVHLNQMAAAESSVVPSGCLFVLQTLIVSALIIVKQLFVAFAILLAAGYLCALLVRTRSSTRALGHWVGFAVSLSAAMGLLMAYRAEERSLLQTTRAKPDCVAWALGPIQFFTDLEGPLYRPFKSAVASDILENRVLLRSVAFQESGYPKGNVTSPRFDGAISDFVHAQWQPANNYDYYCDVETFSGNLFMEGVQKHWRDYARWYVLPEVVRGLFVAQPRGPGSFRFTTLRSFRDFPQFYTPYSDSVLYHFVHNDPWARLTLPWAIGLALNRFTFNGPELFSLCFLLYLVLFLFVDRLRPQGWRGWLGTSMLIAHTLGYIVAASSFVFFHERFLMYSLFGIVIIGMKAISEGVTVASGRMSRAADESSWAAQRQVLAVLIGIMISWEAVSFMLTKFGHASFAFRLMF